MFNCFAYIIPTKSHMSTKKCEKQKELILTWIKINACRKYAHGEIYCLKRKHNMRITLHMFEGFLRRRNIFR